VLYEYATTMSSEGTIVNNISTAFIFIRDHIFVHELSEDMSTSALITRLFGDAIWGRFVELTLDKCIYLSLPLNWDALQKYRTAIECVVSFEETMMNAGNSIKLCLDFV
jgi:hypothetical protein